jgi:Carbohydrate esterase, sialic acid-specific acetylesterase
MIVLLVVLAGVAVAGFEIWALRASCASLRVPGSEVWLALGQSNAANSAEVRYRGAPGVWAFDGRRCVAASDPLRGASGTAGSLWVPLANRVVADGGASAVLIVSRAEGTTAIIDWLPGGTLFGRAVAAVAGVERAGLRVSRVLWQQGEADAIIGTSAKSYAERLGQVTGALHRITGAPVHVAVSGWCGDYYAPDVRAAQRAAARRVSVRAGPDTDLVAGRRELCHFDAAGQIEAAGLWRKALAFELPPG